MSTLAEKIRACIALDRKAAAFVYVEAGRCLALDAEDLTTIADTLTDAESIHDSMATLLERSAKELVAARAEVAALKAKLEERAADAEPVAWMGGCLAFTNSKLVAQRWSEEGKHVTPLYRHPPAPEALPSREDLETVLRTAFDSGRVRLGEDTVLFGEKSGLIKLNGRFYERDDGTPATFAQAVKVCADLVRAQEEEG